MPSLSGGEGSEWEEENWYFPLLTPYMAAPLPKLYFYAPPATQAIQLKKGC